MSASIGAMYNNLMYSLSSNSDALMKLQEESATGLSVSKPSDDPATAQRIMNYNNEINSLQSLETNCDSVSDLMSTASSTIQSVQDTITNAQTLMTQIVNGTYSDSGGEPQITAQAINEALEQVVSLANTQHLNTYIFGGNNSANPPFTVERDANGQITSVTYQGSDYSRKCEVAPGVEAESGLVGTDVFSSNDRSDPVFYGETGAKVGTGTSSVKGDVWLTVAQDGSGNYKLSIDDGATYTTVPAGGEANTAVTDSRTGQVLYVDTRNLTTTGTEMVRVPGTYDIFNTLISARDLLENTKNLSQKDIQNLRDTVLSSLDEVNVDLSNQLTRVGGQINSLASLKSSMDTFRTNDQQQVDTIDQADIAQVAIDLSRRQTLYQMSIGVAAKMLSMSMLDYID
jgi:flagellar hook-associated protein 3 FlgL